MNRKITFVFILIIYIIIGACGIYCAYTVGITDPDTRKSSIESNQVSVSRIDSPEAVEDSDEDEELSSEEFFDYEDEDTSTDENSFDGLTTAEDLFSDTEAESEPADDMQYNFTASHGSGRLFIRDAASMDGNIIGYLYNGQGGSVIEIGDEWVQIERNGVTGYVSKEFITLTPVDETAIDTDSTQEDTVSEADEAAADETETLAIQ